LCCKQPVGLPVTGFLSFSLSVPALVYDLSVFRSAFSLLAAVEPSNLGFHLPIQFIEIYIREDGAKSSTNNVSKNGLDFSINIGRDRLRPQYGDGFAGAPLAPNRGVKDEWQKKKSKPSGGPTNI
jgi:hypothetical protein